MAPRTIIDYIKEAARTCPDKCVYFDESVRSTYSYYQKKDDRIYMGPVWDLDLTLVIYAIIVLFTVYIGWGKFPVHVLNEQDLAEWQQAYELIEEYREKGMVYRIQSSNSAGLRTVPRCGKPSTSSAE